MVRAGFRNFVLNAPWQIGWFEKRERLNLWAGPFGNIANPSSIHVMADMGFSGVIISPELGKKDILALPSVSALPLGVVISGLWPVCISRVLADAITPEMPIHSPKGEITWVRRYTDSFWVYPDWEVNLENHRVELEKAGYHMYVHLVERLPAGLPVNPRPGKWNWNHELM
jgi:putative protease